MKNDFTIFNINPILIQNLKRKNIITPTKIQNEVIPKILKNKDIIAQSKTGTGKTIAYLLPLIDLLVKKNEKVIIIAPTKELAIQIYEEIKFLSNKLKIYSTLLISGVSIENQTDSLKSNNDIIIGVPGRIIKHSENGNLKLTEYKKLVLDEADFLVELGFLNDIKLIYERAKNINQFLVFSATMTDKTKRIIEILNKKNVEINQKKGIPENINNYFFPILKKNKDDLLINILKIINPYLCIIFVRTKETSSYLYNILKNNKFLVCLLNGDLSSVKRKKTINDFKSAKYQYLVSTDLASRGLDIDAITHIINYNLPLNEIDYLHRAGRTGRMNDIGNVYSLCNELDEGYLKKYAHKLKINLTPLTIKNNEIIIYENYKGVKPRFNINDLKIIKRKDKHKNDKKKRNKK